MTDRLPAYVWRLDQWTFLIWDPQIRRYIEVGPDNPDTYTELPPEAVELVPRPHLCQCPALNDG